MVLRCLLTVHKCSPGLPVVVAVTCPVCLGCFFPALLPCQLHIIVAVLGLVGQSDTLPSHWMIAASGATAICTEKESGEQ